MKKKVSLKNPVVQYLIGLAANLVFLAILFSSSVSYRNLQLPEGRYKDNVWKGRDVMTYVRPARNFLSHGVFGEGREPDYRRTIGYPLFLSGMMALFGGNWFTWTLFIQAGLFACIYPALSKTAQCIFPEEPSLVVPVFFFSLISGAYITFMPAILSDMFFTAFFIIGLCFGALAVVRKNWMLLLLQSFFIGFAAQVRPTLIFFPVLNVFMLWFIAKRHGVANQAKIKKMIILSSMIFLVTCNAPSIRNYINHGFFAPTNVFPKNLFNYLARETLVNQGKLDEFEPMQTIVMEEKDIVKRMALRKKFALDVCARYPVGAVRFVACRLSSILLRSHWVEAGYYWGRLWRDGLPGYTPLKKSNILFAVLVMGCFVYAVIYLLFLKFMIGLIKQRDWLFIITLLILITPFIASSMLASSGQRMRLPVEGVIIICAIYQLMEMKIPFLRRAFGRCDVRKLS